MAAALADAGYRVASVDQRGHGASSTGWASYTRTDSAADLIAVVRHLGGPAVLVGHSFAGGAVTIAAAQEPDLVTAIVGISPFTRAQKIDVRGLVTDARYRTGMALLVGAGLFRSVGLWMRYLDHAYPGARPAGVAEHSPTSRTTCAGPGGWRCSPRWAPPRHRRGRPARRRPVPTLIIEGSLDPDWTDARAEGEGVVAAMAPGLGRVAVIDGAGHYPHVQFPAEVVAAVLSFLGAGARG
jgi:pimeloyl-ACP methyl ester carboxylesterase